MNRFTPRAKVVVDTITKHLGTDIVSLHFVSHDDNGDEIPGGAGDLDNLTLDDLGVSSIDEVTRAAVEAYVAGQAQGIPVEAITPGLVDARLQTKRAAAQKIADDAALAEAQTLTANDVGTLEVS